MRIVCRKRAVGVVVIAGLGLALVGPATAGSRLGREVVPTFQSVRLQVDARKHDYTGSVRIELNVTAPTDSFRFHAQEMKLTSVSLRGPGGPVAVTHREGPWDLTIARTPKPLSSGTYTLEIHFTNDFNRRAVSLYRLETGGESYTFTQFEAVEARGAFPCWDEPSFKIPYQLTLVVPTSHQAVSNTPIERESVAGGQKTVAFRRTPPLPSYLLAIATGPFETVSIPGMSVPGRVVCVKDASRLAEEAVRVTPPLLAALEKYFGRPYPFEKLDLIAVPEFWPGAMENPGAITYADRLLLPDPRRITARQRRSLASTTAHELAHMWFGDLVTMAWWDDLWLNESFASWLGDRVTHQVFPEFNLPVAELAGTQRAMETDARLSTHAMRQPVGDDVNLSQLADALAYDKGQAVLGMFEQWLGPETFRRGVLDYINQHEWGNAVGADLWTALSRASDRDVSGPMSSFLERPGVPLVSAEPLAGGRVRLRQQRFLNFGTKDPEPTLWKIPITLRYAVGQQTFTQSVLLAAPEQTVVLDHPGTPAWVHPNADQRGYYRWSVPPATLQELAAHAAAGLNARERVGFLSNAESLLDAGTIHGDEYLRLLGQFSADADPEVVTTILSGLTKVHRTFGPDLEPGFSAFVRQTLSPAVKRFGMTPTRGEPERVSVLRPRLLEVLADFGRDPAVLEQVRAWAATYLEGPMAVDPSVADVALSLAARRGDSARFEEYRTRFERATLPTERARYLLALGGFRDPALVERTLAYALQGPLRPQEILRLPRGIAEAPEYQDRTYRWMTENHGAIVKRIPPLFAASMPWFAGGCSAQRLEMARTFFADPAHSPVGTDREFAEMSEGVLDCVGLNQREAAAVARYLSQMAAAK